MSDEKLSAEIERRLQELDAIGLALKSTNAPRGQQIKDCVARLRKSLARLERERDAARSEALEEAIGRCDALIKLLKEGKLVVPLMDINAHVNAAQVIRENIRALAPSVVSQPSREREVLEEVASALRGILDIGKRDMTNPKYDGYFEEARRVLAVLTATPASTGEQS